MYTALEITRLFVGLPYTIGICKRESMLATVERRTICRTSSYDGF